jgi:hypothetical protein
MIKASHGDTSGRCSISHAAPPSAFEKSLAQQIDKGRSEIESWIHSSRHGSSGNRLTVSIMPGVSYSYSARGDLETPHEFDDQFKRAVSALVEEYRNAGWKVSWDGHVTDGAGWIGTR